MPLYHWTDPRGDILLMTDAMTSAAVALARTAGRELFLLPALVNRHGCIRSQTIGEAVDGRALGLCSTPG